MNLEDLVIEVRKLGFKPDSFIIYGSGPLALHDIRDVNDVDVLATPRLKVSLKRSGWKQIHKGKNDNPVTKGLVEVHDTWSFSSYSPTLSDLLKRADYFDGIPFASLEDVLKWKQASPSSEKNQKDILSIIEKLNSNSS